MKTNATKAIPATVSHHPDLFNTFILSLFKFIRK